MEKIDYAKTSAYMRDSVLVRSALEGVALPSTIIEYLERHNQSKSLGYHNNRHMIGVAATCTEFESDLWLNDLDRASLLMAALFHDFNHTGTQPDQVNIDNAIEGLHVAIHSNDLDIVAYDRNVLFERASAIIACTEFPFVVEPVSNAQKIMRDADLMQSFKSDGIESIMIGLRNELNRAGHTIRPKQMYELQKDFYKKVKLYTDYGKAVFSEMLDAVLVGFYQLAESLEECDPRPELRQYGYAPGGYMVICGQCKTTALDVDKRATCCLDCAEKIHKENHKL